MIRILQFEIHFGFQLSLSILLYGKFLFKPTSICLSWNWFVHSGVCAVNFLSFTRPSRSIWLSTHSQAKKHAAYRSKLIPNHQFLILQKRNISPSATLLFTAEIRESPNGIDSCIVCFHLDLFPHIAFPCSWFDFFFEENLKIESEVNTRMVLLVKGKPESVGNER